MLLDLQVERAVAGGRMLARHDGIVVLVSGAIPGERVRARIEKRHRSLIFARTVEVLEPSPARQTPAADPACGGLDYAHIQYESQLRCKAELIDDAFRRIGRMPLDVPVPVEPSPATGYRMRARLHVEHRRAGFFREGTHDLCDAGPTEQLGPESLQAVSRCLRSFGDVADDIAAVVVAENVAGTARVLHVEPRQGRDVSSVPGLATIPGVSGVTTTAGGRLLSLAGVDHVVDTALDLFGDDPPVPAGTVWRRKATSFFQGNRFLVGSLVRHVLESAGRESVLDLYAGVGLFATALAATGSRVTAVEGEASAASDLERNLAPWRSVLVMHASVEEALERWTDVPVDTLVLDPPRTGTSSAALARVRTLQAGRVIYVSCDPPTLARDTGVLLSGGYRLVSLRAFDLFPNTAHVETVAVFHATSR